MKQWREMCIGYNGLKLSIISDGDESEMDLSVKMSSPSNGAEGHGDNMVGLNIRIGGPEAPEAADEKKEEILVDKVVTKEDVPEAAGESVGINGDNVQEEEDIVFVEILEDANSDNPNVNFSDDWIML